MKTQRKIVEEMFVATCVIMKKSDSSDYKFDTIENMSQELKSLLYTQIVNATDLPRTTVRRIVNQYIKNENVTDVVNDAVKRTVTM